MLLSSSSKKLVSSILNLSTIRTLSCSSTPQFSNVTLSPPPPPHPVVLLLQQPSRSFAARKGTRTKREKAKVKKEVVKKVFMFDKVRKALDQPYKKQRPFDDTIYPHPIDDVFIAYKFRFPRYPFATAVENFKELYHPTMYNVPDSPLILRVNVDLVYPNRPNKFQDGWRSVIEMKAPFILEGMVRPSILAFCPEDVDYIQSVLAAGADIAGSKEIIKMILEGEINAKEYEYIVAHPSMVPELSQIRGLIKKNFPTVKNKTISTDLIPEITRLKSGIKIRLEKNDREPDYGFFETPIGTLNMTTPELESNFVSILRDVVPRRVSGKLPEDFVISCTLRVKHHGRPREEFKVDLTPYLVEFQQQQKKGGVRRGEAQLDEEQPPQDQEEQEKRAIRTTTG